MGEGDEKTFKKRPRFSKKKRKENKTYCVVVVGEGLTWANFFFY